MSTPSPIVFLPLASLMVSETEVQKQRRAAYSKEALASLAASIKLDGVIQPIIVRPATVAGAKVKDDLFEIVAGERRYLASEIAGLARVPALVRLIDDAELLRLQLIENLQREDLHPMQEAEGYHQLMQQGLTVDLIAEQIGKSRSHVYQRLKYLELSATARKAFLAGELAPSIAVLVARIPGAEQQAAAVKEITDRRWTYREAQEWVRGEFMLNLDDAPFDKADPKLVAKAGTCLACPKRTGNAPDLFDDVKGANVCTDAVCFNKKMSAHADAVLAAAAAEGRKVLSAGQCKAATHKYHDRLEGWYRLADKCWVDTGERAVSAMVGPGAEISLYRHPTTHVISEVVTAAAVDAARSKLRRDAGRGRGVAANAETRERKQKHRLEVGFRFEFYQAIRAKCAAPGLRELATIVFDSLDYDTIDKLLRVRGVEVKQAGNWQERQRESGKLEASIAKMSDAELRQLVADCYYAGDLHPGSYQTGAPERLAAGARLARVDMRAARQRYFAEHKPKPKKKKKQPKKKPKAAKRAKAKKAA